jgi:MtN3 and saliva related transmembrane protein
MFFMEGLPAHADVVGFWAGLLTTASFAPQVAQSWRAGGKGLSWAMLALFGGGVTMWFVYGVMLQSWPVMVANAVTALEIGFLATLKLRRRE